MQKKCAEIIRKTTNKVDIDPSTIENDILNWSQDEFYEFWRKVIKDLVKEVVLLDGWEYSLGCCHELLSAVKHNIDVYSQDMIRLIISDALLMIKKSINRYSSHQMIEAEKIKEIYKRIEKAKEENSTSLLKYAEENRMKDEKLNVWIRRGSVTLPRDLGIKILKTVYGFLPELKFEPNFRIEFSIHPSRQGMKKKHTIIWEYEYYKKIEGVQGNGDEFMLGKRNNENLPLNVIEAVKNTNDQLRFYHNSLGDVSIEWVFDGFNVWVVQLTQLKKQSSSNSARGRNIVAGTPTHYEEFFVNDGLDKLRDRINYLKDKNIGIELIGNVGVTSRFGDLLRLKNIPTMTDKTDCSPQIVPRVGLF